MSNRVEDLERQVSELQAAVNGLTEELVEMKERVRQLEDAQATSAEVAAETTPDPADPEPQADEAESDAAADNGERRTHSDDHVEVVERTDDGTASHDSAADDAAAGDETTPEQGTTTPDAESDAEAADDEAESDGDIIVA
ncbi:DUF7518 family protein [Halorubrum laminariae]|uniref:BZIP transcription factor n=1 Tax=Halorubrum laminariae TaxID=1433523 RepID=A0ABD6BZP0_9EURY|nr:bZIP transcription factor [Halorubrum laminariae]